LKGGEKVLKKSGVFALILAQIMLFPAQASGPIPDDAANDALFYRNGYATLLVAPPKRLPFYLLVTNEGTGYFADFGNPQRLAPNGVPEDWSSRTRSSQKPDSPILDLAWTKLSRKEAQEAWGEPHHPACSPDVLTFDAYGNYNGEKNLLHIDVGFDKNDTIIWYMVRGIGILHPQSFASKRVPNQK
jgi:hypothetical protein